MTIKQAIEKAIERGWNQYNARFMIAPELGVVPEVAFLDPLFWQSLGRAMGWEDTPMDFYGDRFTRRKRTEWESYWHRFLGVLADGGTSEDFFKELK